MTVKQFIQRFDYDHPKWDQIPDGFPNHVDFSGLTSAEVGKVTAIKTMWELDHPVKPISQSRVWKAPDGYRYLVQWTNGVLLRLLLQQYFLWLQQSPQSPLRSSHSPLSSSNYKNQKLFDRQAAQVLDAMRSAVANMEEGYARPTTKEYLKFLGYSQASLKEVKGDVQRLMQDGLLVSRPGSTLASIGIDLKAWHEYAKNPANDTRLLEFPIGGYRKLKDGIGSVTYEMFLELINKTDYTVRKLVSSLEIKLTQAI